MTDYGGTDGQEATNNRVYLGGTHVLECNWNRNFTIN